MANFSSNAAESVTYVSASSEGQQAQFESGDHEVALINRLNETGPISKDNEAGGLSNVTRHIGSGMLDQVVNHPVELIASAATGAVLGNAFTVGLKVAKVPTLGLALAGGAFMLKELVQNAPEWAKNVGIAYNPEGVSAAELNAAEAGLHSLGRGTVNFAVSGAAFSPGSMIGKRFLVSDAGKTLGGWAEKIGVGEHSALTRSFDSATDVMQARLGRLFSSERLPVSASLSREEKAFIQNISNSIDGKNGLSAKFDAWADQISKQTSFRAFRLSGVELEEHQSAVLRHNVFKFLGDTSQPLTAVSERLPARMRTVMDAIEQQHTFRFSRKGELFSETEMAALREFRDLARAIDGVSNRAGTALGPDSIKSFNRANERSQLLEPFVNAATLADDTALSVAYKNAVRAQESPVGPYFTFEEMQSIHQTMISNKLQNPIAKAFKVSVESQEKILQAGLREIDEVKFPGMVPLAESDRAALLFRSASREEPNQPINFYKGSDLPDLSGTQIQAAHARIIEAHPMVKAEAEGMLKANQLESWSTKVFPDITGALTVESLESSTTSALRFYNARGEIQGYVLNNLGDDGFVQWMAFDDANKLVGMSLTRGDVQAYKNWLSSSRRSEGHPFRLPDLFSEL